MAMSIDERAQEAREQDEAKETVQLHLEQAWAELQGVPSYVERFRDGNSDDDQLSLVQRPAANFYCRGCGRWEYRSPALMAKYRG